MSFYGRLTVPAEGTVGKINMNMETFIPRVPQVGNLFALYDTIRNAKAVLTAVPFMRRATLKYRSDT